MFPFSLTDSFELEISGKTDGAILHSILRALNAERAQNIRCVWNRVSFRGGQFRSVSRWNRLNAITTGTIKIERKNERMVRVQYHLTFWELFVVATGVVASLFGLILWLHFSDPRAVMPLLGVLWVWLYGVNLIRTKFRFPSFLENAIAPRQRLARGNRR